MTNELKAIITDDMNKAYTGQDDITLSQALARLAAEMYDPYMKFDNEKGTYSETNANQWEQFFFFQNICNHAWAALYDTRTNKKGYVKGVQYKLDKAQAHLKQVSALYDGTEIALNNINSAEGWVRKLEAKVAMFEEMYHTTASMMSVATGFDHKPYEPWLTAEEAKPEASTHKEDELRAKLLERGIDLSVGHVANTNGVETSEQEVA